MARLVGRITYIGAPPATLACRCLAASMEPIVSAEQARPVYVVEDDDAVRASVRLLLETVGYVVRDYASAEALLADDGTTDAACFLLDFQLGGMSGLDLLERMRAQGVRTPAIIVTANANLSDERYKRANVLAVLRKPAPAADLLDWVEKACAQT
jgi:FixJ family two-component response regulator